MNALMSKKTSTAKTMIIMQMENIGFGDGKSSFVIKKLRSRSPHTQCVIKDGIFINNAYLDRCSLETQTSLHISACTHWFILNEPGLLCSKMMVDLSKTAYTVVIPLRQFGSRHLFRC